MINFICTCGVELNVPDGLAHKVVTCNNCGKKDIELPGPGETLDLNEDNEFEDSDEASTIAIEPRAPVVPAGRAKSGRSKRESTRGRGRGRNKRNEEDEEELPSRPRSQTRRLDKKSKEVEEELEDDGEEDFGEEVPQKKRPSKRSNRRAAAGESARGKAGKRGRAREEVEPEEEDDEEDEYEQNIFAEEAKEEPKKEKKRKERVRGSSKRRAQNEEEPEEEIEDEEEEEKPARTSARKGRESKGRGAAKEGRSSAGRNRDKTTSGVGAAKGGRDNRRGGSARKSRGGEEYAVSSGGGDIKIILLIVFVLLVGGGATLYFQFFAKSASGNASGGTTDSSGASGGTNTNGSQGTGGSKVKEKAPVADEFDYKEIENIGKQMVARFGFEGDDKVALEKALSDRVESARKNKMTTTNYVSFQKVMLRQKLMLLLALDQVIKKKVTDMPEADKLCYTIMQRVIDDDPKIDILLKGFPEVDLKGGDPVVWDKVAIETYLKALKNTLVNGAQLVDTFDWAKAIEMILHDTIDTNDNDLEHLDRN